LFEVYLTVFGVSFLAATLIPMSSEVVLASLVAATDQDVYALWALATAGNTLGGVVNWTLGLYCLRWQDRKWFPFKIDQLHRAQRWFSRYGTWTLLLAWVPIVGDPLTFAAGVLRVRLPVFVMFVAAGKGARYAMVVAAAQLFTW
jgi:membrane protein YqaA with SNARE-associated domain